METIRFGSRVASGTQVILEHAEELIIPSNASLETFQDGSRQRISKFAEQPKDFRQGLQMGYTSFSEGIRNAVKTVFAVPTDVSQQREEVHYFWILN